MHNTSKKVKFYFSLLTITITVVLRRKCKCIKIKSLYWTLRSTKENCSSLIIYLTSEQYQEQSIGLRKLIKVSEYWAAIVILSSRLAIQPASLRTKSRFTADVHGDAVPGTSTESTRWSDFLLSIESRDTAAEGGLGAGAGEHVAAVADKQRRKKSVLYRRCECASCRSWSRPVSDVWRNLDSSYSYSWLLHILSSRPHQRRRQEWRWQFV